MRLGILQAGENSKNMPEDTPGYQDLFISLFERAGSQLEITFIQTRLGEFPADIDDYDAYLVTGSAAGVYDPLEWIAPLEDFLRKAFAAGKPLAGICFGHQVIANALGGEAKKYHDGWGCGVRKMTIQNHGGIFDKSKQDLSLLYVHQDQVVKAPPGATVLLGDDFCSIASFAIDDQVLCFQGHPEFTPKVVGDIINLRKDDVGEDRTNACHASLSTPHEGDMIGGIISDFLTKAIQKSA